MRTIAFDIWFVVGCVLIMWLVSLGVRRTLLRRSQPPLSYLWAILIAVPIMSGVYGFGAQEALLDGTYWYWFWEGAPAYFVAGLVLYAIQSAIFEIRKRRISHE